MGRPLPQPRDGGSQLPLRDSRLPSVRLGAGPSGGAGVRRAAQRSAAGMRGSPAPGALRWAERCAALPVPAAAHSSRGKNGPGAGGPREQQPVGQRAGRCTQWQTVPRGRSPSSARPWPWRRKRGCDSAAAAPPRAARTLGHLQRREETGTVSRLEEKVTLPSLGLNFNYWLGWRKLPAQAGVSTRHDLSPCNAN